MTAAKSLVAGAVAIDMLAGPSECLVVTDASADPVTVAADLLAQAEHDVAARAILVSKDEAMIEKVDAEIQRQLATLPTHETARLAIEKNSFAVKVSTDDEAADIVNRLAPEHLEIHTENYEELGKKMDHYGALFLGHNSAEVFGDYGAGPNHTLPTGGTGRYTGGLSVFNFLRIRTWMRIDDRDGCQDMVDDSIRMARLEGLEGHARAAEYRSKTATPAYKREKKADS